MRSRRDENYVALAVRSELANQLVTVVSAASPFLSESARMGLVYDDQPGAGSRELVPTALRFDEIH